MKLPIPDVPWANGEFRTPSGKFEFSSDLAAANGYSSIAHFPMDAVLQDADSRYPYTLLTTHPRKRQNSQRDAEKESFVPVIEIPRSVADELGIEEAQRVRVFNSQASVIATVKVLNRGHRKTLRLEVGWSGQGVTTNSFTTAKKADLGSQSALYDCVCAIEPVLVSDGFERTIIVSEKQGSSIY